MSKHRRAGCCARPHLRASQLAGLALLAAAAVAGPAQAQTTPVAALPALTQPPTQERHPGKIVLGELVTPDLAAAETFYSGLFGWTYQTVQVGDAQVATAISSGHPVAVLVGRDFPPRQQRRPAWVTFFSVQNAEMSSTQATTAGAKLLFGPKPLPNLGTEAILADPQGAVFGLLASASGDPADDLAAPGEWIWSSLLTHDPDSDATFYQNLFGYTVFDLPGDQDAQHLIFADDQYARASDNPLPVNRPNLRPAWISFVRVDSADATAAKAQSLGGRVAVAPHVDRHGGKLAVVLDPQGAAIGLMEWQEQADAGEAK